MNDLTTPDTNRHTSTHGADMIQHNPTTGPTPAVATRYETADVTTLRRALLADARSHERRARELQRIESDGELAAWPGLLAAASSARLLAALLGIAQHDPGMSDASRTRMTRLVGQVLDGWPEVLEGANDDLGAEPGFAVIPGQQEIPTTKAAAHEHSFPIQPPHGSLTKPGDCDCGATYTGAPVTLTSAGDCEPCQGTGLNIGQPGDCPECGGTGGAR